MITNPKIVNKQRLIDRSSRFLFLAWTLWFIEIFCNNIIKFTCLIELLSIRPLLLLFRLFLTPGFLTDIKKVSSLAHYHFALLYNNGRNRNKDLLQERSLWEITCRCSLISNVWNLRDFRTLSLLWDLYHSYPWRAWFSFPRGCYPYGMWILDFYKCCKAASSLVYCFFRDIDRGFSVVLFR